MQQKNKGGLHMIDFKKDPATEPVDENLSIVLGKSFSAYKKLKEKLSDYEASLEWRYYKDGGWLAKVTRKKMTIFWGSAEEGCFSIAFHFNERNKHGIYELDISERLKKTFLNAPIIGGKITSLVINIYCEKALPDVYKLIEYKKRAK
jgi:hypothetical protein